MALLITERPRDPMGISVDATGTKSYKGGRTLDVTGAASLSAAFTAIAASPWNVNFGQSYDSTYTGSLVVGITSVYNPVAGMYTFVVTYSSDTSSSYLVAPPKVSYSFYTYTEERDHDMDNVPYTNVVGTPFVPALDVELIGVIATVTVGRSNYNLADAFTYGNCTNSAVLNLPDGNTVPVGLAKFLPADMADRTADADSAIVKLKFDCRPTGWRKKVVNQGEEAWAPDGAGKYIKGVITTEAEGGGKAGVVLLDRDGLPVNLDTFKKISDIHGNKFNVSSPPETFPASSVIDDDLSSDSFVVLSFRRNDEADLNDLLT